MRPPPSAGDPHLHSGPGLPRSRPRPSVSPGSAPPGSACVCLSSRSSVGSAAGDCAPHRQALENWSKEEKPAANSRQEIDLPSPPAGSRARTGKGWGPAWMAWTRVSQRARVWRKGWQWRVDGGGGGRSAISLPGIYCNVPRGGRQLGAAAPKWRALLGWKGVLGRAGLQEVPEVTPGQAVSCVYKYR